MTNRRDFLKSTAVAAGGAVLGTMPGVLRPQPAQAIEPIPRSAPARMKLSCAAYSFRKYLTGPQKSMNLDDFIDLCADWELDATELTSYYFPENITPDYLVHLKHHAFLKGLAISGNPVANDFCLPPGPQRDKHIAHVKTWIQYAALMGSPTIRIFSGSVPKGHTEQQARMWCVECIEECCREAARHGVFLALENHGGISATPDGLLAVVAAVKSDWFGVNLDTGNFRGGDPYADIARLAPYAVMVQVKTEITPAGGKKHEADFSRIVDILRTARYRGYVALEYEAAEDPKTAVPRHLATLRKLIG